MDQTICMQVGYITTLSDSELHNVVDRKMSMEQLMEWKCPSWGADSYLSYFHLYSRLRIDHFPSDFPAKIVYAFLTCPIHVPYISSSLIYSLQ
jgi:hypothetical protein